MGVVMAILATQNATSGSDIVAQSTREPRIEEIEDNADEPIDEPDSLAQYEQCKREAEEIYQSTLALLSGPPDETQAQRRRRVDQLSERQRHHAVLVEALRMLEQYDKAMKRKRATSITDQERRVRQYPLPDRTRSSPDTDRAIGWPDFSKRNKHPKVLEVSKDHHLTSEAWQRWYTHYETEFLVSKMGPNPTDSRLLN